MSFTAVFFHAHPDDEALYTGGTIARLAAEGHRVVLVTATGGEAGLAGAESVSGAGLGVVRAGELERSAAALGCARLVRLGYADSGSETGAPPKPGSFAAADPGEVGAAVASVIAEERADALFTYDRNGGYGHPDHLQVHRAGLLAARVSGVRLELQATVDREALRRAVRVASVLRPGVRGLLPAPVEGMYVPRAEITHRVDVRPFLGAKRAALQAHASQATGGEGARTVAVLLSLPGPLFRIAMGREWFVEPGRRPGPRPLGDVLASLRGT